MMTTVEIFYADKSFIVTVTGECEDAVKKVAEVLIRPNNYSTIMLGRAVHYGIASVDELLMIRSDASVLFNYNTASVKMNVTETTRRTIRESLFRTREIETSSEAEVTAFIPLLAVNCSQSPKRYSAVIAVVRNEIHYYHSLTGIWIPLYHTVLLE